MLTFSQNVNKQILDEKSGKNMLIGICDKSAFNDSSYSWWFNPEYENYQPDSMTIAALKEKKVDCAITIVMGSWCSDSKREVPRFYKILELIGYDLKKLNLICVDRKKESPEGNIPNLNIKFVPTFIFFRDGKEIGRIIETPKKRLEEDIVEIFSI